MDTFKDKNNGKKSKGSKRAMRNMDIQKIIKLIKGNGILDSTKELFSYESKNVRYCTRDYS